ncbi:MAG: hypothetical protein LLG37_05955, partial [Spirochaetia bacterium]|nr:hypothetical protein [Spirochaetia bacterium]
CLQLFNLKGEQVYKYSGHASSGEFFLDLRAQRMDKRLGSGVYIYLVTEPSGGKKQGKIAIMR